MQSKKPSGEGQVQREKTSHKILLRLGAIALLGVIFGVPAVLIPITMRDVPIRSETKTITTYQPAIDTVQANFSKHEMNQGKRRLMSLPDNSIAWIQLINPMGRTTGYCLGPSFLTVYSSTKAWVFSINLSGVVL